MNFEWDIIKNELNIQKHRIRFEDAQTIFDSPIVERPSTQIHNESRIVAIGLLNGREITVVYTKRENKIRFISARRASRYERKEYWNQV